jgi:hypothetical protein
MNKESQKQLKGKKMFKNIFRKIRLCMVVAALCMFMPASSWALLKSEDIPPLDLKVKMSKEQFYNISELRNIKFDADPGLSYKVRLPFNWIELPSPRTESISLNAELFSDISNFVSPARGDIRSRFRVRSLELKHLVSAENWFLNYTLSIGTTVDGIKIKSDRSLEAQYTVLDGGQTYIVRASAQITGSRIVVAEYLVPFEYALEERDQQIWIITSFLLTSPNTTPIEETDTYSFVDIVKFDYPQSWILYSPPISTIDRMEASILNLKSITKDQIQKMDLDKAKLDGRVDVKVISKAMGTSEADEVTELKRELKTKNLDIGNLIGPVKGVELHPGIISSKIDAYHIESGDGKLIRYEIWVGLLETKGRYYVISLITVGREEKFYVWAQNIETFKYVLKTLSPVNDMN